MDSTVKTLPWAEALANLDLPGLHRNLFSSPEWLAVLIKTYRLNVDVKYIVRDHKVAGYVIYSVVKNFLEWKICICSYCDYCDSYVQTTEDWAALFQSLREEYPEYRLAVRNLRDDVIKQMPEMKVLSRERFHLLDVRADETLVWKKTHDSFKSAVKQAQKQGVVVKRCPRSELDKFYRLHLNVRRHKYRIFPQPKRFFDNVWQEYIAQDKGVLLGAYDPQGNFLGGNIYLICGNTLYYKFNTSRRDALKFRPNNILFWEGIKFAKERGLEFIDMGSSGYEQHGLVLFKNHTGAAMMDITHLGFEPPGYKYSEKRILRTFTKTLTHPWMPDALVEMGSHIIYPFLA